MQIYPRQLAMQSFTLCSHVRCGTSNQIRKTKYFKRLLQSINFKNITGENQIPPKFLYVTCKPLINIMIYDKYIYKEYKKKK